MTHYQSIKIFCPDPSNRHYYIFNLIFKDLLGVSWEITDNINESHINYSKSTSNNLNCIPYGLLEEEGLNPVNVERVKIEPYKNSHCFYKTSKTAEITFDIFSAAFFLVSRYQENLEYVPDDHNRFPAHLDVLAEHKILDQPLVNQWALILEEILSSKYHSLEFIPRKFEYISTIDIDQAWKYKNKGLWRNFAGMFRDLLAMKWDNLFERWPVILGLKRDPFFNYDWQDRVHNKYKIAVNYFILLGKKSKYDKNISPKNKAFQRLIKRLKNTNKYQIGIHPSYTSNINKKLISDQIKRLETVIGGKIDKNRQHFLMHTMPETYSCLIENRICEDHTMGYSTHLGFRGGIAAPYYYFDFTKNNASSLKLIPFAAMDITPMHYLNLSPNEAIETLNGLIRNVKQVGGLFVTLWHNESLSETERWKGWRVVYEKVLQEANASKLP